MESGWDPEVKKYFRKVLFTVSYGLLWLMTMVALGIYHGFAYRDDKPLLHTILFYSFSAITLVLLIRYFYKTWKK